MSDKESDMSVDWEDATYIMPENTVKKKVGSGGIPEMLLQRAEEKLEENHQFDFKPYVIGYIDKIENGLSNSETSIEERLTQISENIMHLKANGGMFGFMLITKISDVALNFADNQNQINQDYIDIIRAHNNSITLIISNKLKGDGGGAGEALIQELNSAISRYNKKHKI